MYFKGELFYLVLRIPNLSMEVTMFKKVCICLLSCLLFVSSSYAVESSYEGFEGYSEGNLVGLEVLGSGYAADAVWKSFGSEVTYQAEGLTYPGLPTTGGSIITIDSSSALYANLDLSESGPFADLIGISGETTLVGGGDFEGQVYISFLVQGEYNNNWGGMTLYNPGEVILFGRTYQNTYFSTTLSGDPAIGDPGTVFDTTKTHLIIAKIDFNANKDDVVSVWIDPDLRVNEASQAPTIKTVGQKSDVGFNFAVFRGDGEWHYDELRIGKAWRDVIGDRKSAIVSYPPDGGKDVLVSSTLAWTAGEEAVPSEYKVYISDTTDQLTESDFVATTSDAWYTPSVEFGKDKTYYWRVDSIIMENNEPNTITGAVWNFDTEMTVPVINSISGSLFGAVGETVSIEVNATDPLGGELNYSWFIGEAGDTSTPTGTNSSILDVEITDSSIFSNKYWCQVSNAGASANTESVMILEKIMLAHLPLESTTDPNNIVNGAPKVSVYINPSNSSGNVSQVDGVVGKAVQFYQSAIVFDPQKASYFDTMNKYCTVSCWVKTDRIDDWRAIISRHGESNGWQLREVWYSKTLGFTTRGVESSTDGSESGFIISDGQWHFVAATFNSGTGYKSVYIDGLKRVTDFTGLLPISDSPAPVVVAARSSNDGPTSYTINDYCDNLMIDEVKLYNYPMTDAEVADQYSAVVGTFCVNDLQADINNDCNVDIVDFSLLASEWLDCSAYPGCYEF